MINIIVFKGLSMKKIGLALGGGGAKGICEIAFLEALDELGYKPSIISGTSIGSIIGAFYAAGFSGKEIRELLTKTKISEAISLIDIGLFSRGLVKGNSFVKLFKKELGVDKIQDLKIPLKIVATDFWRKSQVVFEKGDLAEAVRASISIPAIFEPVKNSYRVLIDGGAVNPLPFDIIRNECDVLIAIDVAGKRVPQNKRTIPNAIDSSLNTYEIMMNKIVEEKCKNTKIDVYVKPKLINVGILDFHRHQEILSSVTKDLAAFKIELQKKMKWSLF